MKGSFSSVKFFIFFSITLFNLIYSMSLTSRTIQAIVPAIAQSEGVGARVRRSIGNEGMRKFNPFLMFDHFQGGEGGFPEHPHLGQETITYMIGGSMAHEDFTGSKGIIREGDLQFMTAGRGIVHSEMPVPSDDGTPSNGLQLWVDLPEVLKESKPRYRDLRKWEVPIATAQDGNLTVKVISGEAYGVKSETDLAYTPVQYYHYVLKPGAHFEQPVPPNYNFFMYVLAGRGLKLNEDNTANRYESVFFKRNGNAIDGSNPATNTENVEFILVGGEVLDQTTVHYGPFVAKNYERIRQGFSDYQLARNSFSNLKTWKTLISNGVTQSMIENELKGSKAYREQEEQKYLAEKAKVQEKERVLVHEEL